MEGQSINSALSIVGSDHKLVRPKWRAIWYAGRDQSIAPARHWQLDTIQGDFARSLRIAKAEPVDGEAAAAVDIRLRDRKQLRCSRSEQAGNLIDLPARELNGHTHLGGGQVGRYDQPWE